MGTGSRVSKEEVRRKENNMGGWKARETAVGGLVGSMNPEGSRSAKRRQGHGGRCRDQGCV